MKQKVVIVGAGGQLGRELLRTAGPGVECIALARRDLDIGDAGGVAGCIAQLAPTLVVNAAAYTAVDAAEADPTAAHRANAEGPAHLARACLDSNSRLIHISTDFVFAGDASQPYTEDAPTGPLGEYGRSKLAGEQAVQSLMPGALILRTGWVYSSFGHNFAQTMLRLMAEREELAVVADQVGTPTWARGLADAVWAAAKRPELSGIYHWSDAGVASWYDFAVAIAEEAVTLGLLQHPVNVRPIATREYPTPARRPSYSVLDKARSWVDLALPARHWRLQLRNMLNEFKELRDE